jgi:hypothetical protein
MALIYAAKALLATGTIAVMLRCVRASTFFEPPVPGANSGARGRRMLNAVPPLFVLMTLASPVVWEHHGIFVALAFLLLLKRLHRPSDWLWFGFAYLLEFLLPTFDFFPWSFGRLVAPILILWLMWRNAHHTESSTAYERINLWLGSLAARA